MEYNVKNTVFPYQDAIYDSNIVSLSQVRSQSLYKIYYFLKKIMLKWKIFPFHTVNQLALINVLQNTTNKLLGQYFNFSNTYNFILYINIW